ncbi:hypothetical protein WBG78_00440 [Chryseolinea sp. T2]|uniref:hypothetical protein n=1 Tax=Chryseolinea sp. T2 TaxID=3129255 RepID=UPI0030773BD2
MDEKISLDAITKYADAYADKVLDRFFSSRDKITGNEIKELCNIQQVNLFVIRELFKSWKEDTKKMQSPYFDYEKPEVKEALDSLMKLLSQNISINRTNFAPLLKKAVGQVLLVVFDPLDYYSMIITGKENKLDIARFKEEIKYLKVNKAPLEKMLSKLEEQRVTEIPGNEALGILDQILEEVSFTPEDVDPYIEKFSGIVPLDANKLYVPKGEEPPPPPPAPKAAPQERRAEAQPLRSKSEPLPTRQKPPVRLTVNEMLSRQQVRPSLAENLQRIGKIRDSLTINQKFMFTKVLFHGDFELFSQAIDHLDKLENKKAALRYIEDEHAGGWDHESNEFHEFMELVEKRFIM